MNASAANVEGGGKHWDNPHTFNQSYPDVGGSARYGFEAVDHDYIGFPQIDDGRYGSVYIAPAGGPNKHAAARIYGAYEDCGSIENSVPAAAVVVTTGDIAIGSSTINNVANTVGFAVGDPINSPKLQRDTVVAGIAQPPSSTITLSKPASGSGAGETIVISHGYQGIELYPQLQDVTVAGTAAADHCNMASNQIVTDDGQYASAATPMPTDSSTQIMGSGAGKANTMAAVTSPTATTYRMNLTDYRLCVPTVVNTTVNVTLPQTPLIGVAYSVDDCGGHASTTNPINIAPSTGNGLIDGNTSDAVTSAYGSWTGYFTGQNWKVTARK